MLLDVAAVIRARRIEGGDRWARLGRYGGTGADGNPAMTDRLIVLNLPVQRG